MRRYVSLVICVAGLFVLDAQLWSEALPVHEPLPPRPQVEPLVPSEMENNSGDTESQLMQRVESQVRQLESRIAELIQARGGQLPAVTVTELPELEDERQRRNQAWQDLRAHLSRLNRGKSDGDTDPLDLPPRVTAEPEADSAVVELWLSNRMRVAQCAYELHVEGHPGADYLDLARATLAELSADRLPLSLRPEWYYLRIAVAVERAKSASDGQARGEALEEADRRLAAFDAAYPGHLRVANAKLLIDQQRFADEVRTVRRDSGM